jgi:hypothetical protein
MQATLTVLAFLLGAFFLAGQLEPTRVAPRGQMTVRPEFLGTHGIVAGGRHHSVHAGTRILELVGVNPRTGTLRGGADPRRERYVFGW